MAQFLFAYFDTGLHGAARKHFAANALADCHPSGHGISCQGRWADAWSATANPLSQQEAPALRRMPSEPAHQSAQERHLPAEQARLLLRGLMNSSSADVLSHGSRCGQAMDAHWPMPLPCRQAKCKSASGSAGGSSSFRSTQSLDNGNGKSPEVSNWSTCPHSPRRVEQSGCIVLCHGACPCVTASPAWHPHPALLAAQEAPDAANRLSPNLHSPRVFVRKGRGPSSCPKQLGTTLLAAGSLCSA